MPLKAYTGCYETLMAPDPRPTVKPPALIPQGRGLTQAALGQLVGLDQTRIAKIERDPRLVSVGQLLKLLAVLHVRVLLQPVSDKPQAPVRDRPSDW